MSAVRAGYKQTEVGVVPEDWSVLALKQLITIKSGFAFSSSYFSDKGPILLTPGNFRLEGGLHFTERNTKRFSGPCVPAAQFDYGDLLIVMTDLTPACKLLGKPAFVDTHEPILHNQRIGKIDLKVATVSPKFLYWFFVSDAFSARMKETATGSTVRHTSNGSVYESLVAVPPTTVEQEVIAEALSDADAMIESLEQLLAKKRHLKQGAMQELLTGKKRLPGFTGGWERVPIGEIAEVKTGPFGSALHESDYVQIGTPIITVEHLGEFGVTRQNLPLVSDEDCRRLSAYSLRAGDIVFSRVGSVDRNALITEAESGWLFSGRLLRVRVDAARIFAPFLSFQFHTQGFKQLVLAVAVGQTMASLNTKILNGILVTLPSHKEQTAIAGILMDMDAEITELESQLAKARALKQGMMQKLLTGEIRLI